MYTRISDCVLFFCTEITRVEDVEQGDGEKLFATIIPEYSDFESGFTSWDITDKNGKSQVVYNTVLRPGFFVPPVVGDYFVKSKLKQSLMMSLRRIECNAKIRHLIAETEDLPVIVVKGKTEQCRV